MSDELLQIRVQRQRLMQQRKNHVCKVVFPEYTEADHEAYKYIAESCNRVGEGWAKTYRPRRKKASSNKTTPVDTTHGRLSANEHRIANEWLREIKEEEHRIDVKTPPVRSWRNLDAVKAKSLVNALVAHHHSQFQCLRTIADRLRRKNFLTGTAHNFVQNLIRNVPGRNDPGFQLTIFAMIKASLLMYIK
jgi:hypothetical protein